jgi:aminotransferase
MKDEAKWISARALSVPWSGVRKMFNFAQKYKGAINLSVGEPDFPTPQHIVEAAMEAVKKGYTRYTPNAGLMEFRQACADKLRKENRIEANPETEIIATVGGMGALSVALLTIVNPCEEVMFPNPGFASYEAQILLAGGKPVSYPTIEEGSCNINLDELQKTVSKKTKVIIINSPANPTGAVFNRKQLEKIAQIAIENDLLVISDEAYEAIIYPGAKHISIASLPGMKERTISIFTFSKTHCMTGWRIGFACANEMVVSNMTKLQEHIAAHPASISQMAAVAALQGPNEHVNKMVKEYLERRDIIVRELNEIHGIECLKPQGAFYVFPSVRAFNISSSDFAMRILEKSKVIIVPGTAFGSNGEGYIRISYATSREKIAEATARIKRTLQTRDTEHAQGFNVEHPMGP